MTDEPYQKLLDSIKPRIPSNAVAANACLEHLRLSLSWITRHMQGEEAHCCEQLLKGCYGAAIEAVCLTAFALVRPGMLSLRAHYELSLQFLFYKDHPIEWRNVKSLKSQPTLPGSNKKYLKDNYAYFEDRFKKLSNIKTRMNEDCYDVLSGIAHGTAINSISSATKPEELPEGEGVVSEAVGIFLDASEYLSDTYVSCFEGNWLSLPELTRSNLEIRFGSKNPRTELDL